MVLRASRDPSKAGCGTGTSQPGRKHRTKKSVGTTCTLYEILAAFQAVIGSGIRGREPRDGGLSPSHRRELPRPDRRESWPPALYLALVGTGRPPGHRGAEVEVMNCFVTSSSSS
jgi:hypothetical protein